jgi:hypothetical protein
MVELSEQSSCEGIVVPATDLGAVDLLSDGDSIMEYNM